MAGYGSEDDHFVVELTYNYGIKEYKLGNDFQVIYSTYKKIWATCGWVHVFWEIIGCSGHTENWSKITGKI